MNKLNIRLVLAPVVLFIAAVGTTVGTTTPAHADVVVEYSEFRDPGVRAPRVEQPVALAAPARTVHTTAQAPKAKRTRRAWFHLGR
jgi:hypothetical protein